MALRAGVDEEGVVDVTEVNGLTAEASAPPPFVEDEDGVWLTVEAGVDVV